MAAQPGLTNNNQNINTGWSGEGGDRGWSYGESPFGFDVAANNANTVIFGDFGFVHKTTNGGQKWQQAYVAVADQNPANQPTPTKKAYHSVGLENTTCLAGPLASDDVAQNTWYASVFSGWGGPPNGLGGLYRTTDRGQSWTNITGSQFARVTSITFNPLNAKQVYLTTEQQGLWMTNDVTVANPTFTAVANYDYRQPERVFFNPYNPAEMWVSSFGNGMRTGNLTATGTHDKTAESSLDIFPNPAKNLVTIRAEMAGKLELYNATGTLLRAYPVARGAVQLNLANLEPGTYFVRLNGRVGKVVKE